MKTIPVVDIPMLTPVLDDPLQYQNRGIATIAGSTILGLLRARIWANWICVFCKEAFVLADAAKDHSLINHKHRVVDRCVYKRMVNTETNLRTRS